MGRVALATENYGFRPGMGNPGSVLVEVTKTLHLVNMCIYIYTHLYENPKAYLKNFLVVGFAKSERLIQRWRGLEHHFCMRRSRSSRAAPNMPMGRCRARSSWSLSQEVISNCWFLLFCHCHCSIATLLRLLILQPQYCRNCSFIRF